MLNIDTLILLWAGSNCLDRSTFCLGAFSSILADYQAVEVIVFILGKTSIMSMAELIKKRHSLASEIDEDSEITSR